MTLMVSNPFSTRFVRPGAIPFIFSAGESAAVLVERLEAAGWRGQIIGPHGSGKSTLLAALAGSLTAAGREARSIALHPGERRIAASDLMAIDKRTQLVIDGYEQLSWWSRWRVGWQCISRGAGLLITAHCDMGLPTIYETRPSMEITRQIVERLVPPEAEPLATGEIEGAFTSTGGNVRETFMRLYDVYQRA